MGMNSHRLSILSAVLALATLVLPARGEQTAASVADESDVSGEESSEGFGRYRTIIKRMPFGEPPLGFDATLPPGSAAAAAAAAAAQANGELTPEQRSEEEQKLAASVRVSVLNVTPSGRTMVGFTDLSAKSANPPKQEHFYMPVGGRKEFSAGQEKEVWEVKDADLVEEKVTLVHNGVEFVVEFGKDAPGDGKGKGGPAGRSMMNHVRRGVMNGGRLQPAATPAAASSSAEGGQPPQGGAMARLRARRLQQQQEEAKRRNEAAEEAKAERERRAAEAEQAAAEREQQRVEREQQRATLLQIQEELRRQREEKSARTEAEPEQQGQQAQE